MLGIGTDLVDIDRFRSVLERTPAIVGRLFTAHEQAYAAKAPVDPRRLALWSAYVAAAAQHFMSNWRLPPQREAHMRSQAMATLSEAVDALN